MKKNNHICICIEHNILRKNVTRIHITEKKTINIIGTYLPPM